MISDKTFSKSEIFKEKNSQEKNAHYLKSMRLREGLSQLELCEKLKNVSQPNLSAWENAREPIPLEKAKRLARLLHCEVKLLTR